MDDSGMADPQLGQRRAPSPSVYLRLFWRRQFGPAMEPRPDRLAFGRRMPDIRAAAQLHAIIAGCVAAAHRSGFRQNFARPAACTARILLASRRRRRPPRASASRPGIGLS